MRNFQSDWRSDHTVTWVRRACRARTALGLTCALVVAWSAGCLATSFATRKTTPQVHIDSVSSALAAIRESRDPSVRRDAFDFLGNPKLYAGDDAKRDEIADILALALAAETDPNARITILRSLARLGSPKSPAAIEQAAGDKDPAVRKTACRVLGQLGNCQAVGKLESVMAGDSSLDVRLAAADALGRLPCRAAAEALVKGLENPDVALRHRCRESLERITGKQHALDAAKWRDEIQAAKFDESAAKKRVLGLF